MPFCPKCRYEYVDGIETCPDCDLRLVRKLHELKKEHHIDEELITVGSYTTSMAAQEAHLKLESCGIESAVEGDIAWRTVPYIGLMDGGVRVIVRESDVEAARKVLVEG